MLTAKPLTDRVTLIENAGCHCYLIRGEVPVLIDSGCDTRENIRNFAESLAGKSVENVVNTHAHFDHTGNNGLFDHVYMTEGTARSAKNHMDEDPSGRNLSYEITLIEDGQLLSFGDINLHVLFFGCHCPGNIMLFYENEGVLFSGDEIDSDQVLLLPGFAEKPGQLHSENAATVNDYRNVLLRLLPLEDKIQLICPGHNRAPLDFSAVYALLSLTWDILYGEEGSRELAGPTYTKEMTHFPYPEANYRRYQKGGYSLVYCADELLNRSENSRFVPATPLHRICAENVCIDTGVESHREDVPDDIDADKDTEKMSGSLFN